ncbi:MAG: alanine/glycine:cation symporter family protein [Porcipelethomonas sp.]
MDLNRILTKIDDAIWGPVMLIFLVGTGIYLTIRMRFLTWRNLFPSLKRLFSKESRRTGEGVGDISPFSALMTALAATIGTGNIVGVATAMVSGGPGALVWMWISALFGITSKFTECSLSIKYRTKNSKGEMAGGPMYTARHAFEKKFGKKGRIAGIITGFAFALFAVFASFGIGNLTQANSISSALDTTFHIPAWITGLVIAACTLLVLIGGVQRIAKVSSVLVPVMAVFYIICGLIVIIFNYENLPSGIAMIFKMAFSVKAVGGGLAGTITASIMQSMRWGVARGVFSNEAGMGSAAITAAAADTDNHVKQGYINMCGTFLDTIVVCTITGLAIASSGMLGTCDANGDIITGAGLTIAAFETVLGKFGGFIISIGLVLFAYSTILGWEYHGEKALEYLLKKDIYNRIYRVIFALVTFVGATTSLKIVWSFSDIANGLMIIPNVIIMLVLSKEICKDVIDYQPQFRMLSAAGKSRKSKK